MPLLLRGLLGRRRGVAGADLVAESSSHEGVCGLHGRAEGELCSAFDDFGTPRLRSFLGIAAAVAVDARGAPGLILDGHPRDGDAVRLEVAVEPVALHRVEDDL